jgi:hypothetical protein
MGLVELPFGRFLGQNQRRDVLVSFVQGRSSFDGRVDFAMKFRDAASLVLRQPPNATNFTSRF